ncbi:MAG: GNAT family N-acetyltransferase, partial [Terriglobia bacterium]
MTTGSEKVTAGAATKILSGPENLPRRVPPNDRATAPSTASLAFADALPEAQSLLLTRADSQDAEDWDEFVEQHPEGRFCHLWGYKRVLEEAVGYKCVYLNILSDGRRAGVFPSIIVRRGSGRLVSQPFNEYGGPLTQGLSEDQLRLLPELLMQVAAEEGCQTVEIRGGIGCETMEKSELCRKRPLHFYGTLDLAPKEQLWRKSLTHEARKDVARAEREGLQAEVRCGMEAVGGRFYDLYLKSMKRLGVPPHSHRFFTSLAETLGNRLVAAWIASEAMVAAVLLGVTTGSRVHIFVTASDSRAWRMRPNDLAHWKLVEWAASAGFKTFDF